jgi:hypothetical protein
MTRMRSPSYPSIPLRQAVDLTGKIFKSCRTNVVSREVAAEAMGYSGLTGRSLSVIAALIQFGLLTKAGKGDVKVTQTAVDILHGEERDRNPALRKAGFSPQLFRDIHERFPEGIPSENAIRSFLIRQEFGDVAIGPAINAFMETYHALENIQESESHGDVTEEAAESVPSAISPDDSIMEHTAQPVPTYIGRTLPVIAEAVGRATSKRELIPNEVYLDIRGSREVHVEGVLDYEGILDLEDKLKALKMILKRPDRQTSDSTGEQPQSVDRPN